MPPRDFNPSASFLLDLGWPNLFEPADAHELGDLLTFRCKGCGTLLSRKNRENHWRHHRRVESARREKEIKRAREQALAKARVARKRRAA